MEKTRVRLLIIIGIAIILISALLPGYAKLQDLISENRRLEKRITELTRSMGQLEVEKEKLENDILYIEKVAREKLGVVREDEVVIQEKP